MPYVNEDDRWDLCEGRKGGKLVNAEASAKLRGNGLEAEYRLVTDYYLT